MPRFSDEDVDRAQTRHNAALSEFADRIEGSSVTGVGGAEIGTEAMAELLGMEAEVLDRVLTGLCENAVAAIGDGEELEEVLRGSISGGVLLGLKLADGERRPWSGEANL